MGISSDLNPYAVAARYPKQLVSDEAEVILAIDKAQRIYDFCVLKIPEREKKVGWELEGEE
jgi:flagellar assembly factor FliW